MRITALLLFLILFMASCKPTSSAIVTSKKEVEKSKKKTKSAKHKDDGTSYFIQQLISTAMEYNGVRYRGGGTTRSGMDCSGLVNTTFKAHDISLPRSSNDMSKVGKKINISQVKKGDLIFFKTSNRNVINHVGLVTDVKDDEIIFIHSSVQRGVIVSSTKEAYYQRTFAQANRVLGDEYF